MTNFKIICHPGNNGLAGRLTYRAQEYSLDFVDYVHEDVVDAIGNLNVCSLSIHTLQIEVGVETGRLLYPWGYCPMIMLNADVRNLPMKSAEVATIAIDLHGGELISGAGLEVPGSQSWKTFKDPSSGWFCIGDYSMGEDVRLINLCQDVMISVVDNAIAAIWLHPQIANY